MQRILIIQTAFIGDVILATPVVRELKRLFPESSIDVLVKKGNGILLYNNPSVRKTHEFDKASGKLKELFRLVKAIRTEKYDLAVNLHRFGSSGILTILSGAKKTIGFSKNPFSLFYSKRFPHSMDKGQHEVERNLSLIKELGALSTCRPELFPDKSDFERTERFKKTPYLCMAPASVWYTKQLPEEKWIELLKHKASEAKIYLLGGPNDIALCERIMEASSVKNIENLAGQLSLMESAALIKDSVRTYVNDSGPLHLASAMNAPVTAFFCSTTPSFGFGPLSDDSQTVEAAEKLPCKPCGLHGFNTCPQGHFKCGRTISIT
ncbi:MAG: hypothetical protein RIT43_1818 [Bacteroidota bacterium]